jgi:hypothetical protein
VSIIPSKCRSRTTHSLFIEKSFALFVLIVSLAVLGNALRQVRAALNHIPVDFAIDKINARKKLDAPQLAHLIDIAKTSVDLDNSNPHYQEDLSNLLFYKVQTQGLSPDTLNKTEQTIKPALSLSPANSYLWYRLATVQLLSQQAPEKIANSLRISIMTGSSEAGFLIARLSLALVIFHSFSENDMDLLRLQVLNAWTLEPKVFLATCVYNKERLQIITTLLENKHPLILHDIRSAFEKTNY